MTDVFQAMTDTELVRLAAKRVMGWTEKIPCDCVDSNGNFSPDCTCAQGWRTSRRYREFDPLTSDADCWQMVDATLPRIDQQDFHLEHLAANSAGDEQSWVCKFHCADETVPWDRSTDRRRAIIIACLRAVGGEV